MIGQDVIHARVRLWRHLAQIGLHAIPLVMLISNRLETLWICLVHLTDDYRLVMPVNLEATLAMVLPILLRIEHSLSSITLLSLNHGSDSLMIWVYLELLLHLHHLLLLLLLKLLLCL